MSKARERAKETKARHHVRTSKGESIWDMVFREAKQEWKHPSQRLLTKDIVQSFIDNYDRLVNEYDGNGKWFFTYLPDTPNQLFEHGPNLDRKMLGFMKMQRVLEDGGMLILVDAERKSVSFDKYVPTPDDIKVEHGTDGSINISIEGDTAWDLLASVGINKPT